MTNPEATDKPPLIIHAMDAARMSDRVSGTVVRDGIILSYTESPLDGRAAHMTFDADAITHGYTGPNSQHEDGTLLACRNLILAMNRHGAAWDETTLIEGPPPVDDQCGAQNGTAVLRIQVVRALVDPAIWKQAKAEGGFTDETRIGMLADAMCAPIVHKVDKLKGKPRDGLILAINALDVPGFGHPSVVERFRREHGTWADDQGFAAIWVVGPTLAMVSPLTSKTKVP